MNDTILIDNYGPLDVQSVQSPEEVCNAVREAAGAHQAVYPIGGRTLLDLGLPPSRPGKALDLRPLRAVIEYPARDMTITVQAGMTIQELQAILSKENQRLPLDVPQPESATIGGTLAANVSGPRRYGFGTARDYVIGISAVNDQGQVIKAGGRVVKNVAGYDLCKLFIGSLGTLGIITQVTLKLKPLPEETALVAVAADDSQLDPLLEAVHQTQTRPVCWDLLNRNAIVKMFQRWQLELPQADWLVLVGYESNREAVSWQLKQYVREISELQTQGLYSWAGSASDPYWRALAELPGGFEARLSFKANLLPSRVAGFCRQAQKLHETMSLQAHAGNGIVIGQISDELSLGEANAIICELQQSAKTAQGNLVIRRCPTAWKSTLPVWGVERNDAWLMQKVKDAFDPANLFNPGRMNFISDSESRAADLHQST
ncbi:MAG: FAD-linked oxidase [Gemmatales bacterium]|nr:MAG: FAD-linked oxidase [Gemmatales bacterium]